MKKMMFIMVLSAITVLTLSLSVFAGDVAHFDVKARIGSTSQLTVNIGHATTANPIPVFGQTAVDFGTLALINGSFQPSDGGFGVVDVGVNSNAATWTVTHTVSPVALSGAPTTTLNNNINVTFVRQPISTGSPSQLNGGFLSYALSNNFPVTNTNLGTGFYLRIFYGIASGTNDANGVAVIPATQAVGSYLGTVTLTLTP
ncbi:MAG: hypothetical protein ACM3IL_00360 [Deltaproteobacteria bacterium]